MNRIILATMACFAISTYAAQTPNGAYVADPSHANIGFSVSHLGFSNVIGRFNQFNGNVRFEANGVSEVNFVIQANSVDTNQPQRDRHIRSDDFFDVETFPTIEFSSTEVTYTDEGDPKTISGNLDLHGEIKAVTFQVMAIGAGEFQGEQRSGYRATTAINRSDFGIDLLPGVVGEEIGITIDLEIIKR